jgi:hemolysin D
MINADAIKRFILGEPSRHAETEFLPAALEIIETPASPAGRAVAATIILFFTVALLWACLGSVDVIAIAQGRVVPSGRTKTIQPFETGVVRAIHVKDGQQVKAGDVLIEIDPTINRAERDRLESELLQERLRSARLRAAAAHKTGSKLTLLIPEGAAPELVELQKRLLLSQVEEHQARLQGLDKQIAQGEANKRAVQSTVQKLKETAPLAKSRMEMRTTLAKKELGSKILALSSQQEYVEQKRELQIQQDRLAESSEAIDTLKEQRRQAEMEFRRTMLNDLTAAEQKIASLQEQLVQAGQRLKLQTLTAPVDGTVQQLAVHTEGGVVTPAQSLLMIVPKGSPLEIEAYISNRDIGFVSEGQEAEIKIDTFNFTKYGLLSGRVEAVSQDAVMRSTHVSEERGNRATGAESDSSEPNGQELVYVARIKLDQMQMNVDGKLVNLTPGMAVTAEIKTGHRRIIEYLLSPLARHSQQALRER